VCAAKQSQPESARAQLRLTEKCAGDFSPANDKLSNLVQTFLELSISLVSQVVLGLTKG
jgi:hypothetical protein